MKFYSSLGGGSNVCQMQLFLGLHSLRNRYLLEKNRRMELIGIS